VFAHVFKQSDLGKRELFGRKGWRGRSREDVMFLNMIRFSSSLLGEDERERRRNSEEKRETIKRGRRVRTLASDWSEKSNGSFPIE